MIDYDSTIFEQPIKTAITITSGDITITDDYIQSFTFHDNLCSSSQIEFGACESNYIEVEFDGVTEDLTGKTLTVTLTPEGNPAIVLGSFKVESVTKESRDDFMSIVAYDRMYEIVNADVSEWYASLTFPMAIADFRTSFASYLDIEQVTRELINDYVIVEQTISGIMSGGYILRAICEANGVFGHITRDGKLDYIALGTDIDFSTSSEEYYSFECSETDAEGIDGVIIRMNADDAGIVVGSDDNPYIVENNYIFFINQTMPVVVAASNLYTHIKDIPYRPATLETLGNPCIEVGDRYTATDDNNVQYTSIVLNHTLSGVEFLDSTISASGNERRETEINSLGTQIETLQGRTASLIVEAGRIDAKVEGKVSINGGTSTSSAQWTMTPDDGIVFDAHGIDKGFTVKANGTEVLAVDKDGLTVKGNGEFSGTVSASTVTGSTVEGGKVHGATIISPTAHEDVTGHKWHRAQMDNGVVGVYDKDADDNVTLRGAVMTNNQLCFHEGTTDYQTDANGAITNVHANAQVAVFGKASECSTLNATSGLSEGNVALSSKYLGINAKATDAAHADNADNATNATNATNWGGVMQGSGGEKTVLNSDSLSAKDANDNASTLHLNYAGGEVKVGAGGSANLSVSGTISEGGTSLVDKYAPYDTTDHIEESELEQGHWWDGGGYQDTSRKRLKSTTRFKGKTRYTITNYSNVVSFTLGYAYIAEHTDTVVDLPTNSSIEVYFDNDFTMYSNNGTESEIINAYTTMRIATTEIQAQLDRNGFGEECGGRNLIVVEQGSINADNGKNEANANLSRSANFIPCTNGQSFISQGCTIRVFKYDTNRAYLGTFLVYVQNAFTVDFSGYIRCHWTTAESNNVMLEQGTVAHSYEPYILSNRQLTDKTVTRTVALGGELKVVKKGCYVTISVYGITSNGSFNAPIPCDNIYLCNLLSAGTTAKAYIEYEQAENHGWRIVGLSSGSAYGCISYVTDEV